MQEPSTAKSPSQIDKKSIVDKKFICPYSACDKKYHKPCLLRTHILSHYNIKPFVCSETNCRKSYTQLCHLQRHRLIHNNKNFLIKRQCNYVKKQSIEATDCSLTRNVNNVVTSGREGNSLENESHLNTQVNTFPGNNESKHSGVVCTQCNMKFSNTTNLRQHLPIHNDTRIVFPCTHRGCDKVYTRKSNLKVHITTVHDGISRFTCTYPGCEKIFKFKCTLKKHLSSHLKPSIHNLPKRYVRPLASQISGYRILILTTDGEA